MNKRDQKVMVQLEQDEYGYPPFSFESLWVLPTERPREFVVDNIPFYAYDISLGDKILTHEKDGEHHFVKVLGKADNSTLRVYCPDAACGVTIQEKLAQAGCHSEKSNLESLFAVNVPAHVSLDSVIKIIEEHTATCKDLEYEDSSNRHVEP
jgi:hypothetical protein